MTKLKAKRLSFDDELSKTLVSAQPSVGRFMMALLEVCLVKNNGDHALHGAASSVENAHLRVPDKNQTKLKWTWKYMSSQFGKEPALVLAVILVCVLCDSDEIFCCLAPCKVAVDTHARSLKTFGAVLILSAKRNVMPGDTEIPAKDRDMDIKRSLSKLGSFCCVE